MKGIRKRGGKFYVDVTVNAVRRTATCETLHDAQLKQQELKAALRKKSSDPSWTIGEALAHTVSVSGKTAEAVSSLPGTVGAQ